MDNIKYLYQKRLNEKLKKELERIEDILDIELNSYLSLLENASSNAGEFRRWSRMFFAVLNIAESD